MELFSGKLISDPDLLLESEEYLLDFRNNSFGPSSVLHFELNNFTGVNRFPLPPNQISSHFQYIKSSKGHSFTPCLKLEDFNLKLAFPSFSFRIGMKKITIPLFLLLKNARLTKHAHQTSYIRHHL